MGLETLAAFTHLLGKFALVVVLAGIIGYERERIHRPAGLRTHIIVGIGALVFSILSTTMFPQNPDRVLANIVTGIGFLGAGTIFREHDIVKGLTTAASLWATAAVGMAVALDQYLIGITGALVIYLILDAKNYPWVRELFWDPAYEAPEASTTRAATPRRGKRSPAKRRSTKKRS